MTRDNRRLMFGERRGMGRSTRISVTAGVVIFLSLISTVSFAAWTTSATKTASVTSGSIAVSTANSSGTATIPSLGAVTYTSSNRTVTRPITVHNTGSVVASVASVAITRTGALPGADIAVKLWAGSNSACAVTSPVISTTLIEGTLPLNTLNMTIPPGGSALLCVSTTFTGDISKQAGKSATAIVVLRTSASTHWFADDSQSKANRTFTQLVYAVNPPTNVRCEELKKDKVDISWTTPASFTTPNNGYNIYFDGILEESTAGTTIEIHDKNKKGLSWLVTIRAVDSNGVESADSQAISIEPGNKDKGISCGS